VTTAALPSVVKPNQKRWYDWPVPLLVADGDTVSNSPDLFRPLPQLFIGVGDCPDSPQGAVSFYKCDYGGFARCWGDQRRKREYGQTCTHLGR
jgi:hypothetical protein